MTMNKKSKISMGLVFTAITITLLVLLPLSVYLTGIILEFRKPRIIDQSITQKTYNYPVQINNITTTKTITQKIDLSKVDSLDCTKFTNDKEPNKVYYDCIKK